MCCFLERLVRLCDCGDDNALFLFVALLLEDDLLGELGDLDIIGILLARECNFRGDNEAEFFGDTDL